MDSRLAWRLRLGREGFLAADDEGRSRLAADDEGAQPRRSWSGRLGC
jgi:hypothetical protein